MALWKCSVRSSLTIFSDCDFFAGCENIISVLLNSTDMEKYYNITFFYRYSKQYEKGLLARLYRRNNLRRMYLFIVNRSTLPNSMRQNFLFRVIWRFFAILSYPLFFILNLLIILLSLYKVQKKEFLYVNNGGYPASKNALAAVCLGHFLGFNKIILSCNNTATKKSKYFILNFVQSFFDKMINDFCSTVVVGSELNKNYLIERRSFTANKIIIIPNGIEKDRFDNDAINISRSKVYTEFSKLTFGIIGVHEERKGHLLLLKSIKKIVNTGILDFKLIIEGHGPLTTKFKDYIKFNSLEPFVEIICADNISNIYKSIDVLVVPSLHSEDLPNTISEAMLFGIAVIGSNLAGIPFQIEHRRNGVIIPIGDEDVLTDELVNFINNPSILNAYKKESIADYYEKFDAKKYISNIDKLLGDHFERIL